MVNKSSFGRGFNSSILNSYVLSLVLCIAIAITLFVLSILNNSFIKNARYSVISVGKPFFIIVAKPFQLINESLIYLSEIKDSNKLKKKLIEENTLLKKQLDKNNFLIIENNRLKNLMNIQDVNYVKKITARVLIDAYKDNGSIIYIDVGKQDDHKINDVFLIPFATNTDSIYVNVLVYNFKKEFKD